ncbi:protein argonaute 10 isoform X2 [Vigna radiata var. radiata]|uniref:Protein argonaute 10 isoform X2 n=1 Tax=Vigna radiata var. radiata TaxID=3916 RepID=A0A3Q0ENL9_VIGRR|nr:protein argonaute 10 isoform X2 [Vigna radiata var. radiata]
MNGALTDYGKCPITGEPLTMDDILPIKRGKSLLAVYWSTQMGLSLNIDVSARAFYEAILVLDFVLKNFRLDLRRPLPDQDRIKVWINEKYKASAILQFE